MEQTVHPQAKGRQRSGSFDPNFSRKIRTRNGIGIASGSGQTKLVSSAPAGAAGAGAEEATAFGSSRRPSPIC